MMWLSKQMLCTVALGTILVGGGLGAYASGRLASGPAVALPVHAPAQPVQIPFNTGSFAPVAQVINPAVVRITGRVGGAGRTQFEEFFGEEFFRRFLGDGPERIPQRSLGSGVILDPSGIALTKAHTVESSRDIEVVTLDGNKHRARVVGLDRKTDLAVLRIEDGKGSFNYARFGDSDTMLVGDWVIAVGYAKGLDIIVTAGIVTSTRQRRPWLLDDLIQTDAKIDPGCFGGPLVNMQGEVIGINTSIISGTGLGFAIPSNLAKKIYTELNAKGKVTRGWLGVSIQPLTPELATSLGMRPTKGVLISDVIPDSPAATAGIRPQDIVLEFDGAKMEAPADLQRAVSNTAPGADVTMKVLRGKSQKMVKVKIAEASDDRKG